MNKIISKSLTRYYMVLVFITIILAYYHIELGSFGRVVYCSAVIFPTINNFRLLPAVLSCFWGISLCIFIPLFPSSTSIVIAEIVIVVLFSWRNIHIRVSLLFFLCLLFICLSGLFYNEPEYTNSVEISFIIALLLSLCINDYSSTKMLAVGFIFMSAIISIIFLLTYKEYMFEYGSNGLERAFWINPNYLGGHISIGLVCCIWMLFYDKCLQNRIWIVTLSIIILLCISTLIMNASRGAILASSVAAIWFILFSRNSYKSKIWTSLLIICFVFILYYNNYLDLLLYRFEGSDTVTGNGRTVIWATKFRTFLKSTPMELLLGRGQLFCDYTAEHIRTHNDFVTSLIAYGYVGLLLYLCVYIIPVLLSKKQIRGQIVGLLLFLAFECSVLESLLRGYLIFYIFYVFVYKMSSVSFKPESNDCARMKNHNNLSKKHYNVNI